MDYRKENHFIVAYENEQMKGKWDILTNEYIGIRGGVLKGKSPAFNSFEMRNMNETLKTVYEFAMQADRWHPFTLDRGKKLEEIISVGLTIENEWYLWTNFSNYYIKLTKDCVNFIKENYNGMYSRKSVTAYRMYHKYNDIVSKCNGHSDWAFEVLSELNNEVPIDFAKGMVIRAIHEKIFFCKGGYEFARLLNTWYSYVKAMDDVLEVKHNILTNYTILQWLYKEYQMAHYDENLMKFNNQKWLYFEDENYIVTPLLSRADFHKEAEAQQNCVERCYMEEVARGTTHVVSVRKKDNPSLSYITCEVSNTGKIIQYLLRFNNHPHADADIDFKIKYASHLKSSLK